jgi:hypothetical protein
MNGYTVEIIPEDERITLDSLSTFEVGQIISHRIGQIGKDFITYLPNEYRYLNTETLDAGAKAKILKENVIKNGEGSFIKLSSTMDIVAGEINTGNIPYNIYRAISTDHNKKIIYAEIVNPNLLSKPVLEYTANLL